MVFSSPCSAATFPIKVTSYRQQAKKKQDPSKKNFDPFIQNPNPKNFGIGQNEFLPQDFPPSCLHQSENVSTAL
jgi:hypothetical protein